MQSLKAHKMFKPFPAYFMQRLTLTVCDIHSFKTFGTFHLSIRDHCICCKQKQKQQFREAQ